MTDYIAISATIKMCLVGLVTATGSCPDGYPPETTEVYVLRGTGADSCFKAVADCIDKVDAIVEINRNGKPLFVLHPDGTVVRDPSFSNDDAARAFWEAVQASVPEGWIK